MRDLKSRREGKSRMLLSSKPPNFDLDRIFFLSSAMQIHGGRYIVYREDELDYLLFTPSLSRATTRSLPWETVTMTRCALSSLPARTSW